MTLLLIDVGRGTQDILLHRPGESWENSIQMILPSPTVLRAAEVAAALRAGEDLLFLGETMGGGPLKKALRRHVAGGRRAWATPRAAATFDDDPEEVAALGLEVVDEAEGRRLSERRGVRTVVTADIDLPRLEDALGGWGIDLRVTAAAVAVQDHGRAPRGMSDRRFRFEKFRERLATVRRLPLLSYTEEDLPEYFTRMQGARRSLSGRGPLLFMDTGFAALLGSISDEAVGAREEKLLLNAGNGHTLAGVVRGDELQGFFEHHTRNLDAAGLGRWLDRLVDGTVADEEIFRDGGHGAFVREKEDFPGWEGIGIFAATGPRRALAEGLDRTPYPAAPHGQMMLTGNHGLFRAFRERCADA